MRRKPGGSIFEINFIYLTT